MSVTVILSKRSQKLIEKYLELEASWETELASFDNTLVYQQVIAWLSKEISVSAKIDSSIQQEIEFILASLRAELLHDLLNSMGKYNNPEAIKKERSSTRVTLKFVFLALAGTLLAGCEGFDSITTMLGVLSLPSFLIFISGLAFSILSIIVFYSYDLIQVSKNLGVALRDAPKLLDIYMQQLHEIKSLRKKIESICLTELPTEELLQLQNTLLMLQIRFQSLSNASIEFDKALNSNIMRVGRILISSAAGLLFFGSGFFAGQSVAMFVAALFIPAVLPTFWPVILFSTIVGLAAFFLYLHFEQDGLKKLVSRWFGLDEEQIEELCDKNKLAKENRKLELLTQKIVSTMGLYERLDQLQNKQAKIEEKKSSLEPLLPESADWLIRSSSSLHCFFAQPQGTMHQESQDKRMTLFFTSH